MTPNTLPISMKIMLVLFMLLAFVTGCPPPFNNASFLHAEDMAAAVQEHLDRIELNGNLGWLNGVEIGSIRYTWPRQNEREATIISYCYYNGNIRTGFKPMMDAALKLWFDQLGDAGDASGHSVKFVEAKFPCYRSKSSTDNTPVWNSLPSQTLVIRTHDNTMEEASAILGHIPEGFDDSEGRHEVNLNQNKAGSTERIDIYNLAHELGHVLGLKHEHQRDDRDDYVVFQCEKLAGYEKAKAAVLARGVHNVEQLCHDANIPYAYNFISPAWSKHRWMDSAGNLLKYQKGVKYDVDSIMHYASNQGATADNDLTMNINYPLLRWIRGKPGYIPPKIEKPEDAMLPFAVQIIALNAGIVKPTKWDVAAIVQMYPWDSNNRKPPPPGGEVFTTTATPTPAPTNPAGM